MSLTKNQFIIAGVTGLVVILAVFVFTGIIPGLRTTGPESVAATISIWSVGDRDEAFATGFAEFKAKYPNVTFSHRSFPDETAYEAALIDALAAGTGPDIFALRNDKVFRHSNKLTTAPQTLIALPELRARFPQIVEHDFYGTNGVYALPLSIDTLAFFYNRDFLDAAGAANPPLTWDEAQMLAPTLAKKDATGILTRSGVALGGTSEKMETAVDILYLLMLQTGTAMTDEGLKVAAFDTNGGLNALRFYLQFGNPSSVSYSWNADGSSARNRFADEKLAALVDYASAVPFIAARNSFLNYAVAPVPQPKDASTSLTYSSYYGFTVSRRSKYAALSWEFIKTLTTSESVARAYVAGTGKPPALRSLAGAYEKDPVMRVFARQILTARSWPQTDPDAIRGAFAKLIASGLQNPTDAANALRAAAREVTKIMERRAF